MVKNANKGQRYSKNCLRVRGQPELYIKGEVLANFAPLPKKKQLRHTSILPTFNHDRRHYTLAFQLPSAACEQPELQLQDHQRRAQEAEQELTEMWMPKPRSRHRYCGVCRGYYEDYKEHLEGEKHQEQLDGSECQKMIKALALEVQGRARKEEEERTVEASEEQLFKCLSSDTLEFRAELWP